MNPTLAAFKLRFPHLKRAGLKIRGRELRPTKVVKNIEMITLAPVCFEKSRGIGALTMMITLMGLPWKTCIVSIPTERVGNQGLSMGNTNLLPGAVESSLWIGATGFFQNLLKCLPLAGHRDSVSTAFLKYLITEILTSTLQRLWMSMLWV